MKTVTRLEKILTAITLAYPPPGGRQHSIGLSGGWRLTLKMQLRSSQDRCYTRSMFLDPDDLEDIGLLLKRVEEWMRLGAVLL